MRSFENGKVYKRKRRNIAEIKIHSAYEQGLITTSLFDLLCDLAKQGEWTVINDYLDWVFEEEA